MMADETNGKTADDEPTISLVYFDGRGRVEPLRYLFAAAQIAYDDVRVAVEEWNGLKPELPLCQLPVIKLKNKQGETVSIIGQSGAILRAYAAKYGFAGETPERAFLADEIYESTRDLMADSDKLMWDFDPPKKEEAIKDLKMVKLPRFLKFFEEKLKENGGKFIAGGEKFTFADFAVACLLDNFEKESDVDLGFKRYDRPAFLAREEFESAYPGLAALKKAVEESPGIKAYLDKRPITTF